MSLEKTVLMNQLFDCYQELLTDKQREMLALYYEEDYSLSEIAEHYDISRQGVHDNIRRGEKALKEYEAILQLNQKREKRTKIVHELTPFIENQPRARELLRQLIALDNE